MGTIPRSDAAKTRGLNKARGIFQIYTLANASSFLLISGRRRISITDAPVSSWLLGAILSTIPPVRRAPPALLVGSSSCCFTDFQVNNLFEGSFSGNTNLHMVGKVLQILGAHCRPARQALLDYRQRPVACSN